MYSTLAYKSAFRILKGGKISLVVSAILANTVLLYGAPQGGVVTSGNASISSSGTTTTINQNSQKASINWNTFSIQANETVNFNQPNVNAITLNRIVGNEKSVIEGAINANGQVWLLNSNGVLFNSHAKVNTSGLLATTKSLGDGEFQNGIYAFKGDSIAPIVNLGEITINNGGYASLLAKSVTNEGTINAVKGTVTLTGANEATFNINGNSLVSLNVDKGVLDALVENKGVILADGGKVYLTTNAVNELLKGVVNNTGLIEANSIDDIVGEVILYGHGGTLNLGGAINAEGAFVETSGKMFSIQEGTVIKAGKWLIDPTSITIDATLASTIQTQLASGDATVTTSGAGSDAGDITVNSTISWSSNNDLTLHADRNININADITATGASAKLTLEYGQAGGPSSDTAYYSIAPGAKINLQSGMNFSTQKQSVTPIDYAVINSLSDLLDISYANNNLSGNYALGSDIDLSSISNWTPIGSYAHPFSGNFDGLGHVVSNMTINNTALGTAGFFGTISGSTTPTISNLGLTNVNVTGGDYTGALAGDANAIINNVYATGTLNGGNYLGGLVGYFHGSYTSINDSYSTVNVTSTGGSVGGLVGYLNGEGGYDLITVNNSYSTGNVSGTSKVGGLVGYSKAANYTNAYASGNVTSIIGNYIGGFAGYLDQENTITNAYAIGSVSGLSRVGGFVGFMNYYNYLTNIWASGYVSATSYAGGLAGTNQWPSDNTVTNGYYDSTTTGQSTSAAGTAITNTNAYSQSTYTGFDFTDSGAWFSIDGYTRPFLRMEATPVISNAHQLQMMSMDIGSNPTISSYILANNIDLSLSLRNPSDMWKDMSSSVDYSDYQGSFVPVGNNSYALVANFDGQNHTIYDLYIYRPDLNDVGLFGSIMGTYIAGLSYPVKIQNLTLANVDIVGNNSVGSVVGNGNYLDFENILITGGSVQGVDANSWDIGGVVGTVGNFSFYRVGSYVDVEGGSEVGGLVGSCNAGTVSQSFSMGDVVSTGVGYDVVGGLFGYADTVTITNSYSSSNITSNTTTFSNYSGIGGIVGVLGGFYGNSTLENSYFGGTISGGGLGGHHGAFIGSEYVGSNFLTITNSFYNATNVSGLDAGGAYGSSYGLPTSSMTVVMPYASTSPSWDIVTDSAIPSGLYPLLRWFPNGMTASAGSSVWIIGKTGITYSVPSETVTYGTTYVLPTPTYTGGTPTGTTTVKVYDSSNNDVTAQALAGTLSAGSYTIKTLLSDANYGIASSGNTMGILTILALNNPPAPINPSPKYEAVITQIVNNTSVATPFNQTQTADTTRFNLSELQVLNTTLMSSQSQGRGLVEIGDVGLGSTNVSSSLEHRVTLVENRSVTLINGGVNLPAGVEQEFFTTNEQ